MTSQASKQASNERTPCRLLLLLLLLLVCPPTSNVRERGSVGEQFSGPPGAEQHVSHSITYLVSPCPNGQFDGIWQFPGRIRSAVHCSRQVPSTPASSASAAAAARAAYEAFISSLVLPCSCSCCVKNRERELAPWKQARTHTHTHTHTHTFRRRRAGQYSERERERARACTIQSTRRSVSTNSALFNSARIHNRADGPAGGFPQLRPSFAFSLLLSLSLSLSLCVRSLLSLSRFAFVRSSLSFLIPFGPALFAALRPGLVPFSSLPFSAALPPYLVPDFLVHTRAPPPPLEAIMAPADIPLSVELSFALIMGRV